MTTLLVVLGASVGLALLILVVTTWQALGNRVEAREPDRQVLVLAAQRQLHELRRQALLAMLAEVQRTRQGS